MNWARLRRQDGVSLLEVLVATALMVTISTAITMAYSAIRLAQSKDNTRFDQIGAARNAAQRIANDVHQSPQVYTVTMCNSGAESTITLATPAGGLVTYQLIGSDLKRSVAGGGTATISNAITTLSVCLVDSTNFPLVQVTVANSGYTLTTAVAPRLMPNSHGVTLD